MNAAQDSRNGAVWRIHSCAAQSEESILLPSTNTVERILCDPRLHTAHNRSTKHVLLMRVVLLVILLFICTAAAVKLVPESLRFKSSPELP